MNDPAIGSPPRKGFRTPHVRAQAFGLLAILLGALLGAGSAPAPGSQVRAPSARLSPARGGQPGSAAYLAERESGLDDGVGAPSPSLPPGPSQLVSDGFHTIPSSSTDGAESPAPVEEAGPSYRARAPPAGRSPRRGHQTSCLLAE
jgi:hypothetical protein